MSISPRFRIVTLLSVSPVVLWKNIKLPYVGFKAFTVTLLFRFHTRVPLGLARVMAHTVQVGELHPVIVVVWTYTSSSVSDAMTRRSHISHPVESATVIEVAPARVGEVRDVFRSLYFH